MVKRNLVKRIAAGVLAGVLTMTTAVPGIGTLRADAASSNTAQSENLLKNAGFEDGTAFGGADDSRLGKWCVWQHVAKETTETHEGSGAAVFTGRQSSLEQDVDASEMIKGATYVYSIWAKLSAAVADNSENYQIGVKNFGGAEQLIQNVRSTEWQKYEIEFTYTGSEGARVFGWVPEIENGAKLYIDDASLTLKSAIKSVNVENGKFSVVFANTLENDPTANDFTASYYFDDDSASAQTLELTTGEWNAETKTLTLNFAEIAKLPGVAQHVNVTLAYKNEAPIALDYTVEAGEGEAVVATLSSVTAENGKVTAVLDKNPTILPKAAQFTWEYKLDDGEYKTLSVSDFAYDSQNCIVTVNAEIIRSTKDCKVTVKVTYLEAFKEAQFDMAASEGTVYYVDSKNGNDANKGTSEGTAFASIDKLNTITFLPGDKILFKRGETFTGCFKPQGSGEEDAPIVIGTYGDPTAARPVLQPGEDWEVTHVMSANALVKKAKVNCVIQFYNVEYWEAGGLEIKDPNSAEYLDASSSKYIGANDSGRDVYRSGITIQAEDAGILEHIYIDDMIIHGFHGPLTNIGKTSGGITMNVITNMDRDITKSTPTQINDIRVTNCEIYDVGRSGINFLTPWSFRTDEKWGPFNYGNRSYEYLPYEDFYMANNYIHDVDGDGTIIDNCSGAVAEYNLVTRCNLRSNLRTHSAAVGLFNWNSDNTTFQFNEVYDIRTGINNSAGDAQGIEIDALNDVTYVQYNYVHDNMGGFMMYCNTGDFYRSFDGIVRYNISQNDYAHPEQGLFDIHSANYGTEIYNNTFYFTDRTLNAKGELFLFKRVAAYEMMKFYNNIFYYDGEKEAVEVNTFGDDIIDWESNIFYGFASLPKNDNPSAPNMNVDPMLENPGSGATGEDGIVINRENKGVIDWADVSGYKLKEGSPAINAGVRIEDETNTRDYFGNEVKGIPDIGAYESGSVLLKLMSNNAEVIVDQETKTITVPDTAKVTAETLLDSLVYEEGVVVKAVRGTMTLKGGIRLAESDVVTGTHKDETISYTVKVAKAAAVIPADHMLATAGTQETSSEDGKASNVLDGNHSTIWHSNYSVADPSAEDKYLTLEIKDGYEYEIAGYVYTPRTIGTSEGTKNGIITKYEIYTSNDNATWSKVSEGSWNLDSEVKTVVFATPVKAKYVKLFAVESKNDHVSAAEVRLTGNGGLVDTEVPTTPKMTVTNIKDSRATVQWTASTDNHAIAEYVLCINGEEYASFDADVTSYAMNGLTRGTVYQMSVYAVDIAGNRSEAASVEFETTDEANDVERLFGKSRYETSREIANELKALNGDEKFDTVLIATGIDGAKKDKFADALSGSYLAALTNAPVLLTDSSNAAEVQKLYGYIDSNVKEKGTIYLLGGSGVVSSTVENTLKGKGYQVERLSGKNRYATNIAILEKAIELGGSTEGLIVATGNNFADSLSASAVKKPILIVDGKGELDDGQKNFLRSSCAGVKACIVGGTGAVSEEIAGEIKGILGSTAKRIYGKDRYETSVKIAESFFGKNVDQIVTAFGGKYPDGLCGGALAAATGSPLILTSAETGSYAADYVKDNKVAYGYVLGGTGVIEDETVKTIFALESFGTAK